LKKINPRGISQIEGFFIYFSFDISFTSHSVCDDRDDQINNTYLSPHTHCVEFGNSIATKMALHTINSFQLKEFVFIFSHTRIIAFFTSVKPQLIIVFDLISFCSHACFVCGCFCVFEKHMFLYIYFDPLNHRWRKFNSNWLLCGIFLP
jgi:hypothetical protein